MKKISFDSTSSVKGVLFQFLIALERCFEMQEGQSVYIETYGDVSILGKLSDSKQIESKLYKRNLTDLDKNVWKSIYNWMREDFPVDTFSSLILLTTQKVPIGSAWLNWNGKNPSERMEVLRNIKKCFDSRKRKDKDLSTYMTVIFDAKNATRLSQIAKMLYIDSISMDGNQYHKSLQEKYGKGIPDIQKGKYINHMFGYILSPNIVSHDWKITYDNFTREAEEITKTLVENTAVFPTKLKLADIKRNDYDGYAFVEKIKDIKYGDDVISEAIDDYVHTASMIQQELEKSEIKKKSLLQYEENLKGSYTTKYRKASRNYNDGERIAKSQDFYDDMTGSSDITFHNYNNVDLYFHNGMLHIMADENDELVWLLKDKTDE
ncbi:MAG: hypothetical protein II298_01315 [Bacteroidales bacterium]|nr:hypothetical protein [Bacteroidales bacterium]MBQ5891103.1 hypothetical protein [Bacteroidales bacterium]